MKGEFLHHPHGQDFHNLAIMVGKSICSERGYTFLDPEPLKKKAIYPGDPDIYIRVFFSGGYKNYILEIETNPTKASTTRKKNQFQSDGITELLIIDMRILTKKKDWSSVKCGELIKFMEMYVP